MFLNAQVNNLDREFEKERNIAKKLDNLNNQPLDDDLNKQLEIYGKAIDKITSGKVSLKEYLATKNQRNKIPLSPINEQDTAYDFEAEASAFGDDMRAQMDKARSKDQYSKLYSYNTDPNGGFNYDKYRSAYDSDEEFDKAGYHPLRDDNEKKYNEKLKENRLETYYFFGLLIIILIPLIIIFVIVINKKNKRLDQIFVEEMKSINKKKR
jgi:hypothetical protein